MTRTTLDCLVMTKKGRQSKNPFLRSCAPTGNVPKPMSEEDHKKVMDKILNGSIFVNGEPMRISDYLTQKEIKRYDNTSQ